jgi:amino acid transporter
VQHGLSGNQQGNGFNDDKVRADHEEALARGEKRVLSRTADGQLYSYARDEIGVVTASSHPTVRSAGGFIVMAVAFAAITVFSILLVAAPTSRGQDPMWGALILTVAGAGGVLYAVRLAGVVAKAKRLRRERGIPEPTSRQFD